MEIQFSTKSIPCCRELFRQTKVISESAECIVSDVYDDIGKIVKAEAQLCLKSKDVTPRGVSIGGTAELHVLYITENRRQLQCMRFSKEFSVDFEVADVTPDTQPQILLCCQGVQARAVNSRKIAAQLSIRAELACWVEDTLTLPSAAALDPSFGLQLRQDAADCILCVQSAEKSFVVSEQLPFSGERNPAQLLSAQTELKSYDCQMIGQKALLKGGVELEAVWLGEDGEPGYFSQCIPFSVLIDAPSEDCAAASIRLQTTAVYCDLGDAINASRVLEVELHAIAQLCFDRPVHIEYLSDAYSTRCPLSITEDTLQLISVKSTQSLRASAAETVTSEDASAEICSQRAELISFAVRDGRAIASAAVTLLLREEDGTLGSFQKLLFFEAELPDPSCSLDDAEIESFRAEQKGEEYTLSAECLFSLSMTERLSLRCVEGAELDTERPFDRASLPSLTLVNRRGRSLWELAKGYHSSVEAIEKLAESCPTPEGLVLIPLA